MAQKAPLLCFIVTHLLLPVFGCIVFVFAVAAILAHPQLLFVLLLNLLCIAASVNSLFVSAVAVVLTVD